MAKPPQKTTPSTIADSTDRLDSIVASRPAKPSPKTTAKTTEGHRFNLPRVRHFNIAQKLLSLTILSLIIVLIGLFSLRAAYASRIYPGVWGNGIYLGGLTKAEAKSLLDKQSASFIETPLFISQGQTTTKLDLRSVNLAYDNQALIDQVYTLGREGNIVSQITGQIALLANGSDKSTAVIAYDSEKLGSTLIPMYEKTASKVENARFDYVDNSLKIEPGSEGQRLDLASLALDIDAHLRQLNIKQLEAKTIAIKPAVDEKAILSNKAALENYAASPLKLTAGDKTWDVAVKEIISWLSYPSNTTTTVRRAEAMQDFYPPIENQAQFELDQARIKHFLGDIASKINVSAQDAELTIEGDRATVFKQSRDGKKLDIDKSTEAIVSALNSAAKDNRTAALSVATTKAAVNDENINNLGIKELLSEGVSYFPGSSAARLTNVRVGSSRFHGVLLKPGETFSFGGILGDVGPEQGYAKSYVILDGKQGTDYGGGLCQVSSTAFRAALLAGLPILERHNHAFAVSYYTQPYGVPGVDATIYYPQVDFKFKNDTGAHILIQTELKGTTLKFKFYGTKTKHGVIRGPQFISGSNDANQPSQTVFWRDVVTNDQVTKTDTFNTRYKSALDYPRVE